MADTAITAPPRSPLSQYADRLATATRTSQGAVRLAELPFLAQVNVRLDAKGGAADAVGLALGLQLPLEPNTAIHAGESTALCHCAIARCRSSASTNACLAGSWRPR